MEFFHSGNDNKLDEESTGQKKRGRKKIRSGRSLDSIDFFPDKLQIQLLLSTSFLYPNLSWFLLHKIIDGVYKRV